jgi:lipopolysaccharide biosynthesis glycosyltransferase
LDEKFRAALKKYNKDNFIVEFNDLTEPLKKIDLTSAILRDYYSVSTYYRLFVPTLFPDYEKAIYLDSDICLNGDIAELYEIDLEDNLAAAVPDNIIAAVPVFKKYAEKFIGIKYKNYINACVLILNLKELRKFNFEQKLLQLMSKFKFPVVQDQDYLNVILKGHTKILSYRYNRMPFINRDYPLEKTLIIHFNLNFKPWLYDDILYSDIFWENAKETEFYNLLLAEKANTAQKQREKDEAQYNALMALGKSESENTARIKELKTVLKKVLK